MFSQSDESNKYRVVGVFACRGASYRVTRSLLTSAFWPFIWPGEQVQVAVFTSAVDASSIWLTRNVASEPRLALKIKFSNHDPGMTDFHSRGKSGDAVSCPGAFPSGISS